jgi:hypothetical protein
MAEKKATRIDSDVLSRLASGQNQVASFYLPPPRPRRRSAQLDAELVGAPPEQSQTIDHNGC